MSLFEHLLRRSEQARLAEIFGSLPPPPEISAEVDDGFLAPSKAAKVMGVTVDELFEMVGRGQLEARTVWGDTLVRPAVVSVLAVKGAS